MAPECFACPEGDRLRWTDRLDIICLGRCSCTNQVSSVSLSVLCRQRMNISPVTQKKKKKGAIKLLKHPIASIRSKHIDVIHHFARERVSCKEVMFEYCSTDAMIADSFTKALPFGKFRWCCAGMGVL